MLLCLSGRSVTDYRELQLACCRSRLGFHPIHGLRMDAPDNQQRDHAILLCSLFWFLACEVRVEGGRVYGSATMISPFILNVKYFDDQLVCPIGLTNGRF